MYNLAENNENNFSDSLPRLRFGETKVIKAELLGAIKKKKKKKKLNKKNKKQKYLDVSDIVLSILVKLENNHNYLIRCQDEVIAPLVLTLFKMSGYVKTSKDKN